MMIALVRKNLACLISKHNSFVCKSHHVSFSLSLHFFSTSRETQPVTSPKVYDVLVHKYQFSGEVASLVASDLARRRSPEKADSILSFLKESGFSSSQLERIAKYRPSYLTASYENDIKFKIKIFQDFGCSSENIAKIISSQASILLMSATNNIIPSMSLLKSMLGSNLDLGRVLMAYSWLLQADLKKALVPNIELLKSCGVSTEQIRILLYNFPRCLLIKPDIMRKSVDKAIEMGVSQSSRIFVYAVRVIAAMSEEIWELKLQGFRNSGFSDRDILTMFRKAPSVFGLSTEKIKKSKELVLATGKFNMSSIVTNPLALGCSIDKRLKPRLQILGILESKNLIKKWPSLGTAYSMTDYKFLEKFVRPYSNELGEAAHLTKSLYQSKER